MVEKLRSWDLWAHESKGLFWHVGSKWFVEIHRMDYPIVPVAVATDPKEMLFEMCFSNGSKSYVAAGRGQVVRLSIQKRDYHE